MSEWVKVVTQPLGLAGFGLFLVFGYIAKVRSKDERRWLSPVAIALAGATLLGGFVLAYLQIPNSPPAPAAQMLPIPVQPQQKIDLVKQSSQGAGSPNVNGVQGDVTITVDQSHGKTIVREKEAVAKPRRNPPSDTKP